MLTGTESLLADEEGYQKEALGSEEASGPSYAPTKELHRMGEKE